jgi:peptide/nickel transport system substrate-binding protein
LNRLHLRRAGTAAAITLSLSWVTTSYANPYSNGSALAAPSRAHAGAIPSGGSIIAAEADTPPSLDPYSNQQLSTVDIVSAVFDGLLKIDSKGNFTPDIATRYTHSPNGLRWKFFLNPKATWQDGVKLTAADVVFTTKLVTNKQFPATSTLGFDHIKTIKAVGDYQVDVTLTKRYAPFLAFWGTAFILPKHILGTIPPAQVQHNSAYNTKPLGSGPFKITQYQSGDHITMVANKNYWLGAPHLDSLIFRIVPSSNTVLSQLRTGEVTLASQTSGLSARQVNDLKHVSGIKTYVSPGFNWWHVDLLETGFLKDVKVREALQIATDRKKIIQDVALGYAKPQYSDVPPSKTLYYNPAVNKYYNYNLKKAQSLLASDGFTKGSNGTLTKNGTPFNLTLYGDADVSDSVLQVQLLKNQWGQLGVNVTTKVENGATLFGDRGPLYTPTRLNTNAMTAVDYEWIEGYDPDDSFFWSSKSIISPKVSSGGNFDGYSNPTVDKLTAQGLLATNTAQRQKIYKHISVILAQQVPDVWLYWADVFSASTTKLHGFKPNPFNYFLAWNAKDWYVTK